MPTGKYPGFVGDLLDDRLATRLANVIGERGFEAIRLWVTLRVILAK
jgi:hypothetical protein